MRGLGFLAGALLAAATGAGASTPTHLPPTDSCAGDRSFVAFRTHLRDAVARRDVALLMRLSSDEIAFTVTGNVIGKVAFMRNWRLDRHPAASPLWHELDAVLRLGCGGDNQGFLWAPAMRGDGINYDDDARVAVGPAAVLRSGPSDAGRALAHLRWDVVTAIADDDHSTWVHVRLAGGRRGYVRRDQLRAIGYYSALFQIQHGGWKLISFSRDGAD